MAVPSSPHLGRGHVTISSKHATPELPVLTGAACELASLDEFTRLPSAAIDRGEAPTPTTGVPQSPAEEDSADESPESSPSPVGALAEPCPGPSPELASAMQFLAPIPMYVGPDGGYVAMWCSVREAEDGSALITPRADGSCEQPPQDLSPPEGPLTRLWCWAQPDGQGGLLVAPCTSKSQAVDDGAWGQGPATKAHAHGPVASPAASQLPDWPAGPFWPFNAPPTTLEISKLPEDFTQEDLLEVLDREEFSGLYDFVFLRPGGKGPRTALVNFVANEHAHALAARLRHRALWTAEGQQGACGLDWSRNTQGLEELVEIHRNLLRRGAGAEGTPQLFEGGWPVEMPPAASC